MPYYFKKANIRAISFKIFEKLHFYYNLTLQINPGMGIKNHLIIQELYQIVVMEENIKQYLITNGNLRKNKTINLFRYSSIKNLI